jgi:tetratricopeptide (TPR) repeat protein
MTFEITPAQPDFSPTCGHGIDQARQKFDDGRRHFSAGDLKQAEQCFMRAVELRHDFAEAHHALGELFAASGRDEDALDAYYLAVHFSPAMAAAHLGIAALLSAGQRHAEAEAACRAALAVDNKSTSAWFCLGNVLKAGGDHVRAMEAYRAACASDPGNLKALHQLAYVEFRLGRYADALRDFQVLLQSEPDQANARHNFGLLLLETGYPQEALDNFRHALRLQPGVVETITCTGHALRDLGQIDEAIAAYDTALALRADFGDAISNRCQTQLLGGDFARGWEQYERRFSASNTRARTVGTSVWRGEDLAGKKLLSFPNRESATRSCLRPVCAISSRLPAGCVSSASRGWRHCWRVRFRMPRSAFSMRPLARTMRAEIGRSSRFPSGHCQEFSAQRGHRFRSLLVTLKPIRTSYSIGGMPLLHPARAASGFPGVAEL